MLDMNNHDLKSIDLSSAPDLSVNPADLSSPCDLSEPLPTHDLKRDDWPRITAPPPPAPGEQEIVKLKTGGSCVEAVESRVRAWANVNDLTMRVAYSSKNTIDIELHPLSFFKEIDQESFVSVRQFEKECMLFYERYSAKEDKIIKLREYLNLIQLMPDAIREKEMIRRGFTLDDVSHLRQHLGTVLQRSRHLSKGSRFAGIRYFRVTYSNKPNSEFTINTGTIEGHIITPDQRLLIDKLRLITNNATQCN